MKIEIENKHALEQVYELLSNYMQLLFENGADDDDSDLHEELDRLEVYMIWLNSVIKDAEEEKEQPKQHTVAFTGTIDGDTDSVVYHALTKLK